eukprot:gnl/MRDRNA2_/MRDRNA2_244187_c0_seq1.p1 gnl/MRDRNA2_/MRDRNA2_244187_c0~~gnl/MRDRNA2_/MRDRNA2_244187_c0_seq1.p1  ORF type:complete len:289 (+),score=50.67 gnl/MRDRNA2_/MRDRNA2_244187_c0_seq1:112-978(+)
MAPPPFHGFGIKTGRKHGHGMKGMFGGPCGGMQTLGCLTAIIFASVALFTLSGGLSSDEKLTAWSKEPWAVQSVEISKVGVSYRGFCLRKKDEFVADLQQQLDVQFSECNPRGEVCGNAIYEQRKLYALDANFTAPLSPGSVDEQIPQVVQKSRQLKAASCQNRYVVWALVGKDTCAFAAGADAASQTNDWKTASDLLGRLRAARGSWQAWVQVIHATGAAPCKLVALEAPETWMHEAEMSQESAMFNAAVYAGIAAVGLILCLIGSLMNMNSDEDSNDDEESEAESD